MHANDVDVEFGIKRYRTETTKRLSIQFLGNDSILNMRDWDIYHVIDLLNWNS